MEKPALERIALALERIANVLSARPKKHMVTKKAHRMDAMTEACMTIFKPGERVVYRPDIGSVATFYRWRKRALADGILVLSDGAYYRAHKG